MKYIRTNYPDIFKEYVSLCNWHKQDYNHQFELLGTIQAFPLPNTKIILCNVFTQKYLTDTKFEVDLDAWHTVCRKIINQTKKNIKATGVIHEMHCPYNIGPGMRSEMVEEVHKVIEYYFADSEIPFIFHI